VGYAQTVVPLVFEQWVELCAYKPSRTSLILQSQPSLCLSMSPNLPQVWGSSVTVLLGQPCVVTAANAYDQTPYLRFQRALDGDLTTAAWYGWLPYFGSYSGEEYWPGTGPSDQPNGSGNWALTMGGPTDDVPLSYGLVYNPNNFGFYMCADCGDNELNWYLQMTWTGSGTVVTLGDLWITYGNILDVPTRPSDVGVLYQCTNQTPPNIVFTLVGVYHMQCQRTVPQTITLVTDGTPYGGNINTFTISGFGAPPCSFFAVVQESWDDDYEPPKTTAVRPPPLSDLATEQLRKLMSLPIVEGK
jgi:hypothetical protein